MDLDKLVLVSLARAGTPIGVLIKRYLSFKYQINIPHYSISIIRGRGIDETAIDYIFEHHPGAKIQFVDGWTGKGAITNELDEACLNYNATHANKIDANLAVLSGSRSLCTYFWDKGRLFNSICMFELNGFGAGQPNCIKL